jgi:hypothetical protein
MIVVVVIEKASGLQVSKFDEDRNIDGRKDANPRAEWAWTTGKTAAIGVQEK